MPAYKRWLLRGPADAVDIVMKRVAADWGGSISNQQYSGGVPGQTLSYGGQRVGALFLEILPFERCQLRLPDDLLPRMAEYLAVLRSELYELGFILSDDESQPRLSSSREDDENFTAAEQSEIVSRLDGLENTLFAQHEFDEEQASWIKAEIQLLRDELRDSRKVTWRHLARSVLFGIAGMVGGQSGKLFLEGAIQALRPFFGRFIPLLGG